LKAKAAPIPPPEKEPGPAVQQPVPLTTQTATAPKKEPTAIAQKDQPAQQPPAGDADTGLRFKPVQQTLDNSVNPALSRLKMPTRPPSQSFRSFLKVAGIILAVVCLAAGVLYFADFGRPDVASWSTAVQSLEILQAKPSDEAALESLKGEITKLAKSTSARNTKAGLMTVWALGHLSKGNTSQALNSCKWIEQNYAETKFAAACAFSNFTQTCQSCRGSTPPCGVCKGSGTCASCAGNGNNASCRTCKGKNIIPCHYCNGTGKKTGASDITSLQLISGNKAKRIGDSSSGASKIKRLGDKQSPANSESQTSSQCLFCKGNATVKCPACNGICPACKGTKKCSTCKGTGKEPSARCPQCNGRGYTLSSESLRQHFSEVIEKVLKSSKNRLTLEKLLNFLSKMQHAIRKSEPEPQPQPTGGASNDLFSASASHIPSGQPSAEPETIQSAKPLVDWDKRYNELYQEYTGRFVAPKTGEKITIQRTGGTTFEGTLVSLTDSNLEIRATGIEASIRFQNTQLSAESRARCFSRDFAAFHARKQCEEEKAK